MAKWQTMYSADYINGAELEGKTPTMTIVRVEGKKLEDENGSVKGRAVVYFKEIKRGWVLAKTNAICVAGMFGDETANWVGKRITLKSEMVKVGGDSVAGIRVVGSPDITEPVSVVVKLARKKPRAMVMRPTGVKANGSARPPKPPEPEPGTDGPPGGDPPPDEAAEEHIEF